MLVADLLALQSLALRPAHSADAGASVRWVATSELVDPTPYLEGGEVLLTTGLETARWTGEWDPYVERLVDAHVSALGLGTGLTHGELPAALVTACRRHGLNLVEVPRPTTFVSVSRAAARLLEEEQEAAARHALDMQRELTQAAVRLDDTAAFLRRLGTLLDGAAVTLTRDGSTALRPAGPLAAELDVAAVGEDVRRIRGQGLRAASSLSTRAGTTMVRPIGLRGRPDSYLAVLVPGRPTDPQRAAVNTAVSLMSLAVESRHDRRQTDRDLRARAVELLIGAEVRTAGLVLGSTTFTEPLPRRVRVLRGRGSADALADGLERAEQQPVLGALDDDELVVVAAPGRAERVSEQLASAELLVGVGRLVELTNLSASHETAGHALGEATPAHPLRRWDDIVGAGAMGLLQPDRAAAFASSFLAPLAHDPDLVETLQSFLRHHGSRGAVAADLGVHRNTVRNRLEQLESLLGLSLDDPQTRVSAWIALQAGASSLVR